MLGSAIVQVMPININPVYPFGNEVAPKLMGNQGNEEEMKGQTHTNMV